MRIEKTCLDDVFIIEPERFGDSRGFFSESWNKSTLIDHGIDIDFVQDNHSLSSRAGTVRGLHFQSPPHAQDKLVRCGKGCLFDVVVDIRKGSPNFGKWFGVELSFENGKQLLVPKGFLHGFITREPDTEIVYKCSDYYSSDCDGAVKYDCPTIGIDWELDDVNPILSIKDEKAPTLAEFDSPFIWNA